MSIARKIKFEPTPRESLDHLWWDSMCGKIAKLLAIRERLCFETADFESLVNERICRFKKWADRRHANSGHYPDHAVVKFLDRFDISPRIP